MTDISELFRGQREFFLSGRTRDISFRVKQLRLLQHAIIQNEEKILAALHQDLKKTRYEGYLTEVGLARDEVRHMIRNTRRWARPRRVRTPIYHFPVKSYIYPEPYGTALIISPWNYPFQLAVNPLINAMAAGNCAVIKPSEFSPATSDIIAWLCEQYFDPNYIATVTGDAGVSKALLEQPFDYIFFTGSPGVGRIVMEAAAKHLTPVTLELGGKSPCIIDADADIDLSAKRVASGKFINAGQTCIAPDYVYVHETVREEFLGALEKHIGSFFGADIKKSTDYPRIVNQRHFDRLSALIDREKLWRGGETDADQLYIEPTVLDGIDWSHPVMEEEIFGPVLPVMTFNAMKDVMAEVNRRPKPLSLYLFTRNDRTAETVLNRVPFGGGCINDTLIHFANPKLPFGGVGNSGMGSYHGKFGFDAFSHQKSIMKNSFLIDNPFRYPPFSNSLKLLKTVFK